MKQKHLDLNTASIIDIELTFHDRERANQIVNKRELLGDFKSWDDVRDKLPGISEGMVEDLREAGVTVGPQPRVERAKRTAKARRVKHRNA